MFDIEELDYLYADSCEDRTRKLKKIIRQLNAENRKLKDEKEKLKDDLIFTGLMFGCMMFLLVLVIFLWVI